jgi:hypothetical protein
VVSGEEPSDQICHFFFVLISNLIREGPLRLDGKRGVREEKHFPGKETSRQVLVV